LQVQALAQFGSLPAGVDLIVMRQEKVSAAKVADIAARVSAAAAAALAQSAVPLAIAPDALAALEFALSDVAVAAITYHNNIEFASKLCLEFAATEGSNFELSGPLHEAHVALKNVLASQNISSGHKTQVAAALRDAVACVNSLVGTRSDLARSHASRLQQLEAKKQHALQAGDIPLAKSIISHLQQHEAEGGLRFQGVDDTIAKLSALISRAQDLLESSAWPKHKALIRFDLLLQRLTTHFVFSKKWFPRFFCMRGRRLYYSNGRNGHPDTRDGTLAFMQSRPAFDGRYCVDLMGKHVLVVCIMRHGVTLLRRLLCSRVQCASGRAGVRVRDHVRCRQPGARKRSSMLRHSLAQSHVIFTGRK
jgi:hypothetical protein